MKKLNLISLINKKNDELNSSTELNYCEISELHMHKILYISYGMFYKEFKRELFTPNFEAWKYGPVEINYRNYLKNEILTKKNFEIKVNDKEIEYLNKLIKKLIKTSPWFLVDFTHSTEAWLSKYDESSKHTKMNNEEIQRSFENVVI